MNHNPYNIQTGDVVERINNKNSEYCNVGDVGIVVGHTSNDMFGVFVRYFNGKSVNFNYYENLKLVKKAKDNV